jgi:hypothetical protein
MMPPRSDAPARRTQAGFAAIMRPLDPSAAAMAHGRASTTLDSTAARPATLEVNEDDRSVSEALRKCSFVTSGRQCAGPLAQFQSLQRNTFRMRGDLHRDIKNRFTVKCPVDRCWLGSGLHPSMNQKRRGRSLAVACSRAPRCSSPSSRRGGSTRPFHATRAYAASARSTGADRIR